MPNFVSTAFYTAHPDIVAQIELLIGGTTRLPACYVRQNQACLDHDTLDRIGEIRCPTLILAGGLDAICSPQATTWMQERLPQAETVLFESSSHFFLIEEHDRFMSVLGDWFRRYPIG